MGMTNQLSIIPALLVSLGCVLLLYNRDEAKGGRRLLGFLTAASVLVLSVAFITSTFFSRPYQPISDLAILLPATIWGILTLIILNRRWLLTMTPKQRQITLGGLLLMLVLMGLLWRYMLNPIMMVGPGIAILLLAWSVGRRYPRLLIAMSVLALLYFLIFFQATYGPWPRLHFGLPMLLGFLMPSLMVVMAALLIADLTAPQAAGNLTTGRRLSNWARGALALSLLICLAYAIYWMSVWDQTSDGLGGVFTAVPAGYLAIITGMVMVVAASGKTRIAGILFMLLVPTLFFQAFHAGWRVSYHTITEVRAARIAAALDQFQAREGHYPETLADLTPRDLLWAPRPVILRAEDWCYQASDDHYRLAAFYREFFSSPVSLRVYATAGEPPAGPWECEDRVAEVKARYYSPMEDPAAMRPPLPTPLPPIEVGIPKTVAQPVLEGVTVAPGSWAPDSVYFVFVAQTPASSLRFLHGKTREICTTEGEFSTVDSLREHHAWLPDGRLLYLDRGGDMVVLTPCQPGVEQLTGRLPAPFTQIAAYEPESGRLLLLDDRPPDSGSFWIMDGRTFSLIPIPDVTPNAYELHWDRFAWLPGGDRLVISRLDGRRGDAAGSTLYLINGDSGQVEKSLYLPGDFGQGAPWVEGLTEWEIALHGLGDLFIVDFRTELPQFISVFADIFGLDVNFGYDLSGHGFIKDNDGSGYYLVTRLNHPRNQSTYLYHSATGQIHRYDHENHTLLLFPDGQLVEMAKQENVPAYRDDYDVILVATPEVVQPRLSLSGHVPREYAHLSIKYLTETSQIAVASAQGISLVSWPAVEMVAYWDLPGDGFSPWLIVAPDGATFVAVKGQGGLYGPLP
jgi:hypothetical protein